MKYGVLDIGSNTVVLAVYTMNGNTPKLEHYFSEPVHLVGYNINGHISQEGIDKTVEVLQRYHQFLETEQVTCYGAFITEPVRRIDNAEDVLEQFNACGFVVNALSGREEAELDFYGTRIDSMDIPDGNAFDIGGGSTELITFKDHEIVEAMSLPAGCVRLGKLPPEPEITDAYISEALRSHPLLNSVTSPLMIGIGGTCRAARKMYTALYGDEPLMKRELLEDMYHHLVTEDPKYIRIREQVVDKGRQQIFLPGLNMLISILKGFHAEQVRLSSGCVREGFLLNRLVK